MRPGSRVPPFSIEVRAVRLQRRYTGPWKTEQRGPLMLRYRRRPRREYMQLGIAVRDFQREFWLGVGPILARIITFLDRLIPGNRA